MRHVSQFSARFVAYTQIQTHTHIHTHTMHTSKHKYVCSAYTNIRV